MVEIINNNKKSAAGGGHGGTSTKVPVRTNLNAPPRALHVPQMMVGRPPTNSEAGTKLYISNLDNQVTNKAKNLKKPVVLKNAPSPSSSSRASASTKTKQSRREAVDPHDKILKVVARCEKSTEKCMKLFDQHNRAHD